MHNLAADPAYQDVIRQMCARLWRFAYAEHDTAINPYVTVGLAPYGPAEAFQDLTLTPEPHMNPEIHPISFGMVNSYLLRGDGCILVDAGTPGQTKTFLRQLEKTGIQPDEIDLVVCTHGHMDHIGIARDIKALTGAQLAIHKREREWLESGISPLPPGTTPLGKLLSYLGQRIPTITVPPVMPDILIEDDGLSLAGYGIPGKWFTHPGTPWAPSASCCRTVLPL